MAIRNVKAVGDDQKWKTAAEEEIAFLREQIVILTKQVNSLLQRIN